MSSKNILLSNNLLDKKCILNSVQENILKEYLQNNYSSQIITKNLNNLIKNNIITKIDYINKNKIYLVNNKNKLLWFYKKIILPKLIDNSPDIFKLNEINFNDRYTNFFNIQHTNPINNYQNIISIISYQYIYMKYVNHYLFQLSAKENYYIHNEIISSLPDNIIDNHIMSYSKKYIDKYNILYQPINERISDILSEEDETIINFLKKIVQDIIKKTQKIIQNKNLGFKILTYGSYTSYNLNKNVIYNDIDIYHTNPLKFLVLLMMSFYFLLGINVDIFKIPFILGHLSLRYKNVHFTDCIYMDLYTMENIPTTLINNISFVDPLIQMLNNFRMMSELSRLNNLQKNKENVYLKYSSLLNYANKNLHINFKNLKVISDIKISIIDNEFLIINLIELFTPLDNYHEIKHLLNFDYLIISLCKPTYFLKLLDRDDIIISKQYFALFNEIIVEISNKDKISSLIHHKDYLCMQNIEIRESQINIGSEKTSIKFPEIIENIIKNNNVLLMTNISTDIYIKNYITSEKCIINNEISDITKETILSSFILYHVIKHKPNELIVFYMKILLSFLINNSKQEEFELLSKKINKTSKYNNMYKQKKIKISGNHFAFTLLNPTYLRNIFFYKNQNSEYYNYKNFIEITNYNEQTE